MACRLTGAKPSHYLNQCWIFLIGPLRTNFNVISIESFIFSFTKMRLKMSSEKWRPFCLGLNVLRSLLSHGGLRPWENDPTKHYSDVMMGTMASQITSLTTIYSTAYSRADQSKHQSSTSLVFVREIHWWPVNSPHKGLVTRNMFPFDDVIMNQTNLGVASLSTPSNMDCLNIRRPTQNVNHFNDIFTFISCGKMYL